MITYICLHLLANKTLELVYENAPECTILKWKNQKFSGEGAIPRPHPTPRRLRCFDSHCFLTHRTLTKIKNPILFSGLAHWATETDKRNWTRMDGDGCNFRRRADLYFLLVKQLETLTHAKDRSMWRTHATTAGDAVDCVCDVRSEEVRSNHSTFLRCGHSCASLLSYKLQRQQLVVRWHITDNDTTYTCVSWHDGDDGGGRY